VNVATAPVQFDFFWSWVLVGSEGSAGRIGSKPLGAWVRRRLCLKIGRREERIDDDWANRLQRGGDA
jgi:hypothetical protein